MSEHNHEIALVEWLAFDHKKIFGDTKEQLQQAHIDVTLSSISYLFII